MLNLVGIAEELERESWPLDSYIDRTADGECLGSSQLPAEFRERYGLPAMGVKRTDLNIKLKDMALRAGIEVREGWELEDIEEGADSVTAHFRGERTATGSFLIGCDGIKAATRKILLRKKGVTEGLPTYSGLTQVKTSP